jgi:drug/metabolite transporter (DMT)-like permease
LIVPLIILLGIVIASAAQTEVAHHLSSTINYHQPYFTFFLTHITFSLVFPLHLLLLRIFRPRVPLSSYLSTLCHIIAHQLDLPQPSQPTWRDIALRWSLKVSWLTLLISIPALSWFVAMLYTTALDVTTIYATSSFHAYFFSMILLKQPLSRVTVGSIGVAFMGVIVIALAGMGGEKEKEGASNRMLGDVVMMFGWSRSSAMPSRQ